MDSNVDDARLLKRDRLRRAAWEIVRDYAWVFVRPDGSRVTEAEQARQYAEYVAWAKANDFTDMTDEELKWAYDAAYRDSLW
jgi:hypothetical protein